VRRGFTILETIYASILFAFITLFILNIYPGSMVAIHRADTQIVADNFAQTILEDLRSRSFANLDVNNEPYYVQLIYGNTEYTPVVDLMYHQDYTAANADVREGFLKVARVTVRWKFQHRDREVVHVMYLHNITRGGRAEASL